MKKADRCLVLAMVMVLTHSCTGIQHCNLGIDHDNWDYHDMIMPSGNDGIPSWNCVIVQLDTWRLCTAITVNLCCRGGLAPAPQKLCTRVAVYNWHRWQTHASRYLV